MSARILIEPSDLKDAARSYREAAAAMGEIPAKLRTPPPGLPADLAGRATETVARAARDLREQREYMHDEARALERRAAWAQKADAGTMAAFMALFDLLGLGAVTGLSDRFGKPARPDLAGILDAYQVAEDDVRSWEPSWPLNHFTDPEDLTETEIGLLESLSPLNLKDFKDAKERSLQEANGRYGSQNLRQSNDGHEDAFRHAYWNALMAREFGPDFARKFGTAHEGVPGNPAVREAMDLYNNEVGRRIQAEHPDADEDELAQRIQDAVKSGEMLVVDKNGNLAYSDSVGQGEHGEAKGAARPGGKPAEPADSGDAADGTGS